MKVFKIDELWIHGAVYYNVEVELDSIQGPEIETTFGGFFVGGPPADVVRTFCPGIARNIMKIRLESE